MKLKNILLFLAFVQVALSVKLWKNLDEEAAQNKVWQKVGDYIVKVMLNDESARKGRVELVIMDYFEQKFQQPATQIMKTSEKIVVESFDRNASRFERKDFVLIVLQVYSFGGETEESLVEYIQQQFSLDFPNRSAKFFVVFNGKVNGTDENEKHCCLKLQRQMARKSFHNTLCIANHENTFDVFRVERVNGVYATVSIPPRNYKFPMVEKINNKTLNVLQYDWAPYSYIEKGKLLGIHGLALDEFCRKYSLNYVIVNRNATVHNLEKVAENFHDMNADISFNTDLNIVGNEYDNINLNEIDGHCFLVPKNIHVSNQEYFSWPFDSTTSVLLTISSIMTILLWKVISIYTKSDTSMTFIIFETFKCLLGLGVEGFEQMCRKAKLLLFSYTVASMLLGSLYQTIMIAYMLTEPYLRSVRDFKELNESNIKIYQYFDDGTDITFRADLIMNRIKIDSKFSMHVPEGFNPKIAYLVPCSYAKTFERSKRNFKANRQILEKMPEPLIIYSQSYPISSGFPMKKELKQYAEGLREYGIRKFWIKELIRVDMDEELKSKERSFKIDDSMFLDLKDMTFPFLVLITGCIVGAVTLLFEQIIIRVLRRRNNRITTVREMGSMNEKVSIKKLSSEKLMAVLRIERYNRL